MDIDHIDSICGYASHPCISITSHIRRVITILTESNYPDVESLVSAVDDTAAVTPYDRLRF